MNLEKRLEKLEEKVNQTGDGQCHCEIGRVEMRTYFAPENDPDGIASHDAADADTRPPDPCCVCGDERMLIKVIYADDASVAMGR